MKRDTPRIGVEILIVGLVMGLLIGALGLIVEAHRRSLVPPKLVPVAIVQPELTPEPVQDIEPPTPVPVAIDLTPGKLRAISDVIAKQKALAALVDQKSAEIEKAVAAAEADADRWKSRASLLRSEVAAREADAARAEAEVQDLAIERDVLNEKRDEVKQKLNREALRARDGVAVMPYKGQNGTWRRPIAIECRSDSVILQPEGKTYAMKDLVMILNPRRCPLVLDVAKAMIRAQSTLTPDGAASVPYLMFVVRPDGVRPYYAARTILEPLGITYGYELADADWQIEYPDLDDPAEWSDRPSGKREWNWPPPPVAVADAPDALPSGSFGAGHDLGGGGPSDPITGDQRRALANAVAANRGTPMGRRGPGSGKDSEGFAEGSNGSSASALPGGLGGLGGDEGVARPSPSAGPGPGRDGNDGSGWGRLGQKPGSGFGRDSFAPVDLNTIGRGEGGGRATPNDGRIPWHPGSASEFASMEPTPPSGMGGGGESAVAGNGTTNPSPGLFAPTAPNRSGGMVSGSANGMNSGSGTSVATAPNRSGGVASSSANGSINPGTGSSAATAANRSSGLASGSANSGTESLREAIAQQHGLVSPSTSRGGGGSGGTSSVNQPSSTATGLKPPSRSGGGGSSTPSGSQSGGSQAGGGGMAGLGQPGGGQSGSGDSTSGSDSGSGRDPFASRSLPMTVSCEKTGVTIHPGGATISIEQMRSDDSFFVSKLREIVEQHQNAEPELGFRPRVKFLVQPGGEVTYLKARWQANNGTSYPTTWQVVDRAGPMLPDWGKP